MRQKPVGHLCSAADDHCTADANGTSVQPSEGQQHGMKTMVQAEQMKVCMLKSLLLYASSSFKSHIILWGCGDMGSPAGNNTYEPRAPARLLPAAASPLLLSSPFLSSPAGAAGRARSERFFFFPRPRPGAPARRRLPLARSAVRPAAPPRSGPLGRRRCRCRWQGLPAARLLLRAAGRGGGGPARPGGRIRGASWPGWIFYRSQNGARSKPAQRPAAATAGPGLASAR